MEKPNAKMAQAVSTVNSVTDVQEHKGPQADVVVIFDNDYGVQELRAEWLRNHRDDFQIVEQDTSGTVAWMQLKA